MKDLDSIKKYILSVEHFDYTPHLIFGSLMLIIPFGICSLAIEINTYSVITVGIVIVAYIAMTVLYVCRRKKLLNLNLWIMSIVCSLSFCSPAVNQYCDNGKAFPFVIVLSLICYFATSMCSVINVKNELKRNSCCNNKRSVSSGKTITNGKMMTGSTIFVTSIYGTLLSKQMELLPGDTSKMVLLVLSLWFLCFFNAYGTEYLIRHIYICKYDLEDYVKIKGKIEDYL